MVQIFRQIIKVSTNLAPKLLVSANELKKLVKSQRVKFFSKAWTNLSSTKLAMMNGKLKKLYEHPLFHGIKTEAEAYDICKAEIQQFGKPGARTNPDGTHFDPKNCYIFFLLDEGEHYSPVIFRYCESAENPFERVPEEPEPKDIHTLLLTNVS